MKPDNAFKWLMIVTMLFLMTVGIFEVFSLSVAELNGFLFEFRATIISLGTLFLVLLVGLLTTVLANHYADRRESMNRKISAALAISEFRQKWIDSLREDIAEFSGLAVTARGAQKSNPHDIEQIEAVLASRILLRMNSEDEDYNVLVQQLKYCSEARSDPEKEADSGVSKLRVTSQKILKREWEKLKIDLENAQTDRNTQ